MIVSGIDADRFGRERRREADRIRSRAFHLVNRIGASRASTRRRQAGPGRPRDPEVDRAILDAAHRLLGQRGYGGMSIDAVISMLIGSLYAAHIGDSRIARDWPARAVRTVLEGLR